MRQKTTTNRDRQPVPFLDKTPPETAAPGTTRMLGKLRRPNLNRQVEIWVPRTRRTAPPTSEIKTGTPESEIKTGTLQSEIKTGTLQSETVTTHRREIPEVSLMRRSRSNPDRDNATLLQLQHSGNYRHTSPTRQDNKPSSLAEPAPRHGRNTAWDF